MTLQSNRNRLMPVDDGGIFFSATGFAEILQAVLQKGMSLRFKASGISMSPFIKDGDLLTASPLHNALPKFGDVVVCLLQNRQRILVHRLIAKKQKTYWVKGDNTDEMVGPLDNQHLLGRISKVERNDKRVLFGMGPERYLIALFNRSCFHWRFLLPVWQRIRPLFVRPEP